jgi:hypothetical protein
MQLRLEQDTKLAVTSMRQLGRERLPGPVPAIGELDDPGATAGTGIHDVLGYV